MRVAAADENLGLGLDRGSVVVWISVTAAGESAIASIRSVLRHSEPSVSVILSGTAESLAWSAGELGDSGGDKAIIGLSSQSRGIVCELNSIVRASSPSDVVVVAPGVLVADGWLERLGAAALSDSTVASATPLSSGPGAVELRGESAFTFPEAAGRIGQGASAVHPRIATIGPGCAYIRRGTLELSGPLDETLGLSGALARLALRASALGMVHVAADDVLVEGSPELAGHSPTSCEQEESYAQETLASDEHGPLRRSINIARRALGRLSVTIDGRALNAAAGGTQTYIIELILALAQAGSVSVRVLCPPDLSERAAGALASLPEVELLTYEQALAGVALTDVVHRPQQVFTLDDLTLLRLVGERIVIGQQDLVAYHNHSYHRDGDAWRAYRRTTRLALAGADQVVFFSAHARRDALAEDLLPVERTHVVGIGAESIEPSGSPGIRPPGLSEDVPFLLCLGADYAHKNRPFAIRLAAALREAGWPGRLVLAGSHVPYGSSQEDERELFSSSPDLKEVTVDLGPVGEEVKNWLYAHARALLYPTLYEGFGLLPVEAARAGLPCLFAAQASLAEVAGGAATLIPWDVHASAAAVLPLLRDGPARDAQLAQLRELPMPSWSAVADRLTAVYEHALSAPASEAAPRTWQELDRENYMLRLAQDVTDLKQLAQEYQDAYHSLEGRVSGGLPLIDEGGLLSPAQQRGLMRIAGRGRLGALAVTPLGLLGGRGRDAPER